jgi:hypothetical protein
MDTIAGMQPLGGTRDKLCHRRAVKAAMHGMLAPIPDGRDTDSDEDAPEYRRGDEHALAGAARLARPTRPSLEPSGGPLTVAEQAAREADRAATYMLDRARHDASHTPPSQPTVWSSTTPPKDKYRVPREA